MAESIDFSSIFDIASSADGDARRNRNSILRDLKMASSADGDARANHGDDEHGRDEAGDGGLVAHIPIARTTVPDGEADKDDEDAKRYSFESVHAQMSAGHPGIDPDFSRAVAYLLQHGSSASDIHLAAHTHPRVRIDGSLHTVPGTSVWASDRTRGVLESIASPKQVKEYEQSNELDLAYSIGADMDDPLARFRVNVYHDRNGVVIALRIIPTIIKTVEDLGLPQDFIDLAQLPRGLVLVCGPTGSGKSTTLASIIDEANRTRDDHIITIEDPIEFLYVHKRCLVNQREVGSDTESFAEALKRALREDPDIIEIGEMRDLETISAAITAAETGHLVFGTLHTQDAPQTIDRIINVFPSTEQEEISMMLSMSLKAVIVQTLVPRIGGGRCCATEVMYNTPSISALIREHKTAQISTMLTTGQRGGMHTMDQSLQGLVSQGLITSEDAFAHAGDRKTLKSLIGDL